MEGKCCVTSCSVLYTALALGANPVLAGESEAEALRDGDMRKLVFAETPRMLPDVAIC